MKERPILFSAQMVRALLDSSKTQTRRIAPLLLPGISKNYIFAGSTEEWLIKRALQCPYGQPGDQLWVREAWRTYASLDGTPPRDIAPGAGIQYEALGTNIHGDKGDYLLGMGKYRPSMFMPRWASRITLEITNVRVERLQDISDSDAVQEGIADLNLPLRPGLSMYRSSYADLWESINGKGSWTSNPWVWVIEFKCNNSQTTKETL